jgi:hypothetical protein
MWISAIACAPSRGALLWSLLLVDRRRSTSQKLLLEHSARCHELVNGQCRDEEEQVRSGMDQKSSPQAVRFERQDTARQTESEGVGYEDGNDPCWQVSDGKEVKRREIEGWE